MRLQRPREQGQGCLFGPWPAQCGFIRDSVTRALPKRKPQAGVWGACVFALGFSRPQGRHNDTPPSVFICIITGLWKPPHPSYFLSSLHAFPFSPVFCSSPLPFPPPEQLSNLFNVRLVIWPCSCKARASVLSLSLLCTRVFSVLKRRRGGWCQALCVPWQRLQLIICCFQQLQSPPSPSPWQMPLGAACPPGPGLCTQPPRGLPPDSGHLRLFEGTRGGLSILGLLECDRHCFLRPQSGPRPPSAPLPSLSHFPIPLFHSLADFSWKTSLINHFCRSPASKLASGGLTPRQGPCRH